MKETLFFVAILVPPIYLITKFLFDLILRGFAPFLTSRPWVVGQIMRELDFDRPNMKMIAFSTGRSGFFRAMEKRYPSAEFVGVEPLFFHYLVSRVQAFIRRSKIKVIRTPIHRLDLKEYDLIYSHLKPDTMRGLGRKMKFECKTGCIIISTGFNYASLNAKTVVPLPDRRGRLDWLSKNQKLFSKKSQQFKKEKKAFIYEIA